MTAQASNFALEATKRTKTATLNAQSRFTEATNRFSDSSTAAAVSVLLAALLLVLFFSYLCALLLRCCYSALSTTCFPSSGAHHKGFQRLDEELGSEDGVSRPSGDTLEPRAKGRTKHDAAGVAANYRGHGASKGTPLRGSAVASPSAGGETAPRNSAFRVKTPTSYCSRVMHQYAPSSPPKDASPGGFVSSPPQLDGSPPRKQTCRVPHANSPLRANAPADLVELRSQGLVKRQFQALSMGTPSGNSAFDFGSRSQSEVAFEWKPKPISARRTGISPRRFGEPTTLPPASPLPPPRHDSFKEASDAPAAPTSVVPHAPAQAMAGGAPLTAPAAAIVSDATKHLHGELQIRLGTHIAAADAHAAAAEAARAVLPGDSPEARAEAAAAARAAFVKRPPSPIGEEDEDETPSAAPPAAASEERPATRDPTPAAAAVPKLTIPPWPDLPSQPAARGEVNAEPAPDQALVHQADDPALFDA